MPLIQSNPEVLTRYLYNSNYIRKSNQTVKWAAFMPNPKDNQTSVFRVLGLSESEIWNIADCDVTPYQQNTIKGRADINSNDVINISPSFYCILLIRSNITICYIPYFRL